MKNRRPIIIALALFASCAAYANRVVEWRLEDKAAGADLVFIGTVYAVRADESSNASPAGGYATIGVTTLLKGEAGDSIELRFGSNIAELVPDCCTVGRQYIFFLSRQGGVLRPVNPPFGIVRIEKKARSN